MTAKRQSVPGIRVRWRWDAKSKSLCINVRAPHLANEIAACGLALVLRDLQANLKKYIEYELRPRTERHLAFASVFYTLNDVVCAFNDDPDAGEFLADGDDFATVEQVTAAHEEYDEILPGFSRSVGEAFAVALRGEYAKARKMATKLARSYCRAEAKRP